MNRLLPFLLFLLLPPSAAVGQPTIVGQPKIVAYFAEWNVYSRNYNMRDIPAEKLTHVNYAFAKIVGGQCAVSDVFAATGKAPDDKQKGGFNELQQLKKQHPRLKTLISIGGWTLSGEFSDAAFSQASRTKFAKSCVAFIRKYQFDGVDIDWEYPGGGGGGRSRKEDTANFTLMLAELRSQLDAAGQASRQHYLLTIAAPAGPGNIKGIEVAKIHPYLDWLNIMTYDFHGGWDKATNFNAPLYAASNDPASSAFSRKLNADATIKIYLAAGVPPEKIVMGVPFYGRGWGGVKNAGNGLFQPKAGPDAGTWDRGSIKYCDLATRYIGIYPRHWHDEAKVPWLFNPKTGVMISYDDPQSIRLKAEYAREHKLGGIMIWEISGDDPRGELLSAVRAGLSL
jgi:chitinase